MTYQETQRFPDILLGGTIALVALINLAALMFLISDSEKQSAILPMIVTTLLIALLLFAMKLRTTVSEDILSVRLVPFQTANIPLDEIQSVEIVTYNALRDFGGWGLRYGKQGKMYNARGNRAVKLDVKSKGVIFIGSQTPEKLASALRG